MRTIPPGIPLTTQAVQTPGIFGRLGALKYRDYRLFWTSSFISNVGTWIQMVAQGWLILQLTDSAFWLGAIGFVGGLPALVFSLVGGVFADRVDRRKLLMVSQSVQMFTALLLGWITATGRVTILWVAVLAFVTGLAMAMSGPAYQTMAKDLAGKDFTSAIALNSTQFNLARTLGPSLAAVMLTTVGSANCFYINGLSYVAVIGALFFINPPPQPAPERGVSWRGSLAQGFDYVRVTPSVQWLLLTIAVSSVFAMPYITLLPIFAQNILKVGSSGLGWLTGAVGLGAVVSSIFIASQGDRLGKGRVLFFGSLGLAVTLTGFALSTNFVLSLALLFLLGVSLVCQITVINTLLQTRVPDRLRGRVMSMFSLAFIGVLPLGNLLIGTVAEYWGVPLALTCGALIVGLFALQSFWRHREMFSY